MKKFLLDASTDFVKSLKQKTWARAYLLLVIAIGVGAILWFVKLFDLSLAVTLAVVEIPIIVFGAIIANTILRESRKQAEEIGEEVGKQLGKIPVVGETREKENQKHIDDHCEVLIKRFREYSAQIARFNNTVHYLYSNLTDKEQLLQHYYTGHEELFFFLKQTMELEREEEKIPKPIIKEDKEKHAEIKKKLDEVTILYRKKLMEVLGQIDRKSIRLGGICTECTKWHDSENSNFKELDSKLKSFAMPF